MTPIPTELRELMERTVTIINGYNDRSPVLKELRALLATPPAADMGGQAGEEVVAWCTPERDRVITEITKAGARADGGAMLSSVQPYSEPLMTVSQHLRILAQHRQQSEAMWSAHESNLLAEIEQHRQQAGKLGEALREIHFRADCFVEDDMDMRVPSIEAIVRIAGEALAAWDVKP